MQIGKCFIVKMKDYISNGIIISNGVTLFFYKKFPLVWGRI